MHNEPYHPKSCQHYQDARVEIAPFRHPAILGDGGCLGMIGVRFKEWVSDCPVGEIIRDHVEHQRGDEFTHIEQMLEQSSQHRTKTRRPAWP